MSDLHPAPPPESFPPPPSGWAPPPPPGSEPPASGLAGWVQRNRALAGCLGGLALIAAFVGYGLIVVQRADLDEAGLNQPVLPVTTDAPDSATRWLPAPERAVPANAVEVGDDGGWVMSIPRTWRPWDLEGVDRAWVTGEGPRRFITRVTLTSVRGHYDLAAFTNQIAAGFSRGDADVLATELFDGDDHDYGRFEYIDTLDGRELHGAVFVVDAGEEMAIAAFLADGGTFATEIPDADRYLATLRGTG